MLPLLSNHQLPERPVYSEIYHRLQRAGAIDAAGDPDLVSDSGVAIPSAVRFRTVRYPARKYWLVGQAGPFPDAELLQPPEEVVFSLFRILLGRRPSDEEHARWLGKLAGLPASDLAARRALAVQFETSDAFRAVPKYAIGDLRRDPLETRLVDARLKPADWTDYQTKLDMILYLDRVARAGAPLQTNETDEQIILKRLADLGYVE